MAKGNMLLGLSSGKVGDLVMYRSNGRQITRVRVRQVKNPKTNAQMLQRMVLATVGTAASKLKTIVNHSFEGVEYGARSLARFRSLNMNKLRAAAVNEFSGDGIQSANYNIRGFNYIVPNSYVVSRGSLNVSPYGIGQASNAQGNGMLLQTSVNIPSNFDSYEAFLAAFGLKPGDQLTIIEVRTLMGQQAVTYGDAVNTPAAVGLCRIVFNKNYTGAPGEFLIENGMNGFLFSPDVIDMSRSTPGIQRHLCVYPTRLNGSPAVQMSVRSDELFTLVAGAYIRSAEDGNGNWYRSNSEMVFNEITAAAADTYTSYGASASENIGSDYYLNNALTATSEDAVEPVPAPTVANIQSATGRLSSVTAQSATYTADAEGAASGDIELDALITFESNDTLTCDLQAGSAYDVTISFAKRGSTYYLNFSSQQGQTEQNPAVLQIKKGTVVVYSITIQFENVG